MRASTESCFYNLLITSFPTELKVADVSSIFKKDDPLKMKNYRPVSVLPVVSKIFEKLLHKQTSLHVDHFLSPYLCGYRKGVSTHQTLISLLEKWKTVLDMKRYIGAILMDLSKAFDTLNHDLLMAKLHAYGFSEESLKLIKSYVTNRWQRTKFNISFSIWSNRNTSINRTSYAQVEIKPLWRVMSCHKAITVISGREHCFHSYVYIYTYR